MTNTPLLASTGVEQIDQIIAGLVGLVELSFPGRARGYYLEGSYADGTAVAVSDIDMGIVFAGHLDPDEGRRFGQLLDACKQISPCTLDVKAYSEAELAQVDTLGFQNPGHLIMQSVGLKLAGRLVYGQDTRAAIPLVPIETYARFMMHFPYRVFAVMRRNLEVLTVPLDYPDPAADFYGYARRQLRARDGTIHLATKQLLLTTAFTAGALVAHVAGQYVGNKRAAVELYRRWIGDEWAAVLEEIEVCCRERWGYLLPTASEDREHLRGLCRQGLTSENLFLARYREYLLAEIQHSDEAIRLFAVQRLGRLIYQDDAVVAALGEARASDAPEIQEAAEEALRRYL